MRCLQIVKQFTGDERGRYVRAAEHLRLPFWDWAKLPLETADSFPRVFTDEEVLVSTPSGRANITNPLKSYVFRPNENHSFMNANETYRRPNFAVSDILQLRADLWAALSSAQTYPDFSTEARLDGASKGTKSLNPSNLEAIQDHVHFLVGGHMSVVSQAAFDPIFWLHHTNVDRILAIYQAVYTDEWVSQSVGGRFFHVVHFRYGHGWEHQPSALPVACKERILDFQRLAFHTCAELRVRRPRRGERDIRDQRPPYCGNFSRWARSRGPRRLGQEN